MSFFRPILLGFLAVVFTGFTLAEANLYQICEELKRFPRACRGVSYCKIETGGPSTCRWNGNGRDQSNYCNGSSHSKQNCHILIQNGYDCQWTEGGDLCVPNQFSQY